LGGIFRNGLEKTLLEETVREEPGKTNLDALLEIRWLLEDMVQNESEETVREAPFFEVALDLGHQ
jgi:hypothetical protein